MEFLSVAYLMAVPSGTGVEIWGVKGLGISASLPTVTPELEEDTGRGSGFGDWVVTVYNNNFNTWDEVMMILQVATGCGPEEAYIETREIDNLGCSVVHQGSQDECNKAAEVIATIGIKVQVSES